MPDTEKRINQRLRHKPMSACTDDRMDEKLQVNGAKVLKETSLYKVEGWERHPLQASLQ